MSTITFKLQEIPHAEGEPRRGYFPVLAYSARITSDQFCQMIQNRCTVTEGDVKAVMSAMAHILRQELADGVRVEVPELGSFSPSLSSGRPITDASDTQIARHLCIDNIKFQPKASLKKGFSKVSFRRADKLVNALPKLTDEEVMARIKRFLAEKPDEVMDRRTFQSITGYGRTVASRVLSRLIKQGRIEKKGRRNAPYYVLVRAEE